MNAPSNGRYEAAVATLIAVLAVAVSAYTAYMQRQQVRAQVWPILEVNSGNEPELRLWIANKGVGPALIRHATVSVDGKPMTTWRALLVELYGPGKYSFWVDEIRGRVLSAGEVLPVFIPRFGEGQRDLAARFDKDRSRIGMEICYCSTLGDCWTVNAPPHEQGSTTEISRCPKAGASSFQQ